jgi:hypothetical protein
MNDGQGRCSVAALAGKEILPIKMVKGVMQHMVVVFNVDFRIGKGRFCQWANKSCRRHGIVFSNNDKRGYLQGFSRWLISFEIKGWGQQNKPVNFFRMFSCKASGHQAAET